MKTNALLLLAILICNSPLLLHGQYPMGQIGGRALGVSGASLTYSDVWSQYHNQAGLAGIKGITIGLGFQNEFLIKELSTKSIAFAFPLKSGTIGLNYYQFGYSKFNENKVGLAFASKPGRRISAGIQLDYIYTHIDGDYGNNGTAAGEIGILAEPIKNLLIGAHVFNVWHAKHHKTSETLPSILKIGASYHFNQKALLSIEFEKDMLLDPIFKTGLEFELFENLHLRTGIATNPEIFSFGSSYSFGYLRIDLGFKRHPVLGYSQGISIMYSFKEKL